MPNEQIKDLGRVVGDVPAAIDFLTHSTINIEDSVLEIIRYMGVRNDVAIMYGIITAMRLVPTTQIRPILQRKYHVRFLCQCVDTATKKVFYASKVLSATHLAELDMTTPDGVFEKSNGATTNGDIGYHIVSGGVEITPTGDVIITVIRAS